MPFLHGGSLGGGGANVALAGAKTLLASGNVTTTSTSLTDLTGVAVTGTLNGGNVLVGGGLETSNSTANNINFFEVVRGSTALSGGAFGFAQYKDVPGGTVASIPISWNDLAPASGSTTYKIQWAVTANTGTVYADGTNRKALIFMQEVPLKGAIS